MNRIDPWSPRYIYLYLVCIVTLVMVIFATVNLVRSVAEMVYPQPEMVIVPEPTREGSADAEAWAASQRDQQLNQQRWATRNAVLAIIGSMTMLLIAGPLYLYHWRKVERERGQTSRNADNEG
jgi:hypothetical protein